MRELISGATASLQEAGWTCVGPLPPADMLPGPLLTAPDTVIRWACSFSLLTNTDETVWFVSREDYSGRADSAFAWNELEQLSAEAAMSDQEAAAVSEFWKRHIPILLSVRHGYEYLAVRDDGAIVHGSEPAFEETVVVFPRFGDLLNSIAVRQAERNSIVNRLLFDATGLPHANSSR